MKSMFRNRPNGQKGRGGSCQMSYSTPDTFMPFANAGKPFRYAARLFVRSFVTLVGLSSPLQIILLILL